MVTKQDPGKCGEAEAECGGILQGRFIANVKWLYLMDLDFLDGTYFSSYPSVFLTSIVAELKLDAPCRDEMLHNVHCLP